MDIGGNLVGNIRQPPRSRPFLAEPPPPGGAPFGIFPVDGHVVAVVALVDERHERERRLLRQAAARTRIHVRHERTQEADVVGEHMFVHIDERLEIPVRHQSRLVPAHRRQGDPARHVEVGRQIKPLFDTRRHEIIEAAAHLRVDREPVVRAAHHRRIMVVDAHGVVARGSQSARQRARFLHRLRIIRRKAEIDPEETAGDVRRLLEREASVAHDDAPVFPRRLLRRAQAGKIESAAGLYIRLERCRRPSVRGRYAIRHLRHMRLERMAVLHPQSERTRRAGGELARVGNFGPQDEIRVAAGAPLVTDPQENGRGERNRRFPPARIDKLEPRAGPVRDLSGLAPLPVNRNRRRLSVDDNLSAGETVRHNGQVKPEAVQRDLADGRKRITHDQRPVGAGAVREVPVDVDGIRSRQPQSERHGPVRTRTRRPRPFDQLPAARQKRDGMDVETRLGERQPSAVPDGHLFAERRRGKSRCEQNAHHEAPLVHISRFFPPTEPQSSCPEG